MTKQLGGLVLDPEEEVILVPRATDPRLKLNTDVVKSAINTVNNNNNNNKWFI